MPVQKEQSNNKKTAERQITLGGFFVMCNAGALFWEQVQRRIYNGEHYSATLVSIALTT